MADGGADRPPYRTALALGLWAWEKRSLIEGGSRLQAETQEPCHSRHFLDAGYALLLEDALRVGVLLRRRWRWGTTLPGLGLREFWRGACRRSAERAGDGPTDGYESADEVSEFLAEAQVLIRPDTTKFRAELLAQVTAATRGVTASIPILAGINPAQMQLFATSTGDAADEQMRSRRRDNQD